MADTAAGIAVDLIKKIYDFAQDVKTNKESAIQLARLCELTSSHLIHVFASNTIAVVAEEVSTFNMQLGAIAKSMRTWVRYNIWDRITKRDQMKADIANYRKDIKLHWKFLENSINATRLAMEVAAAEEKARRRDSEDYSLHLRYTADGMKHVGESEEERRQSNLPATDAIQDVSAVVHQLESMQKTNTNAPAADRQNIDSIVRSLQSGFVPHSVVSADLIMALDQVPINKVGQFATIYKCRYGENIVALKILHALDESDVADIARVKARIARESLIWGSLNNRNVVPFLGCFGPANTLQCMMSPWMAHGDFKSYAKANPNADCLKLCLDVAKGLKYIHSRDPPVVHGMLKASNILISDTVGAMITDFALSCKITSGAATSRPPPLRWSAPEILDPEERVIDDNQLENRETSLDIFGFANVVLEVMTLAKPYANITNEWRVSTEIRAGRPPAYQAAFADRGIGRQDGPLWKLMLHCWSLDPKARPVASEVLDRIFAIWRNQE